MNNNLDEMENNLSALEMKIWRLLWRERQTVVSRDMVAQAMWDEEWMDRFSDWEINTMIYRLRHKLPRRWEIVALRGRGYELVDYETTKRKSMELEKPMVNRMPPQSYIDYMNNRSRIRKTVVDLIKAMEEEGLIERVERALKQKSRPSILVVNSYSMDNIEHMNAWIAEKGLVKAQVVFSHYDDRAIKIHLEEIIRLKLTNFVVIKDDLRETNLIDESYDLVINDFRLNFNNSNKENILMVTGMNRLLKNKGLAIVSTVVDARYESERYGENQEKAPLHINQPWLFMGSEKYERFCWPAPYYRKLIKSVGWEILREFDINQGKNWVKKMVNVVEAKSPHFRRWLVKKVIS